MFGRTSTFAVNITVVFLFCLIASTQGFQNNAVPGVEEGPGRCDQLAEEVTRADRDTIIEEPPRLPGKWVSEGCEVRAGPEFLMRSYTFFDNHTFHLLQFHYGDESCALALYTLAASGEYRLRGRSWVTPGATEVEYTLARVTVTPHGSEVAEELAVRVNATCPGLVRRRWKAHRDYVVYNVAGEEEEEDPANNLHPPSSFLQRRRQNIPSRSLESRLRMPLREDVDCLAALHAVFHELQLLRVQRRPRGPPDNRHPRYELLLGDVHSRPELRWSYRPTAFQTPLLRADQAHGCAVCHSVTRSSQHSPPHLLARPRLPALLWGEWISARCEVRPLGLFLKRRLRFHGGDRTWRGEYRFFSDPVCSSPTFTATASGRYGASPSLVSHVEGGTELDFRVDHASLTILERGMAESLQRDARCAPGGLWRVGEARDLTPSRGCAPLGIVVPTTEYELVRVDMDASGNPLLLMGQPDTDNRRRGPHDRPTAYQQPLVHCRSLSPYSTSSPHRYSNHHGNDLENHLFPIPHARVGLASSVSSFHYTYLLIITSTIMAFLM